MNKKTIIIVILILSFSTLSNYLWSQVKLSIHNEKNTFIKIMKDSIQLSNYVSNKILDLQNSGFINASIDSLSKGNEYILYIHRGRRYKLKSFKINYSSQIETNYRKKQFLPEYANLKWIQKQKKNIIKELENTGFPFAKIKTQFTTDSTSLHLKFYIDRGKQYKFDSIITNKIKLKKYFLQRYLNIKPGDLYNEQNVFKIKDRLLQLSYLKLEDTPSITFGENTVRPEIILKNKPANYFNGLIGIVPDQDKTGQYSITGDIELSLINTLGRGESIDIQWKKNKKNSQQLNIKTKCPYILNTPFGLEGEMYMLKQDTSHLSIDMRIGSFILFNGNNSASGYYSDKHSTVLSPIDSIENINTKSYGTGIALKTFKINNILNPLKGYWIKLNTEAGSRTSNTKIENLKKGWYWEISTFIQGFFPIYKRWTLMLQNRSSIKQSQNPYYKNELFRIGGMRTLRGFDENEFYTNQYTINTLEIRWLFEKNSHIKLFTDHSFIETKHIKKHSTNKAFGFGIGLNLNTSAGIFTISYALGKQNRDILKLNNAKIHFGYINNF